VYTFSYSVLQSVKSVSLNSLHVYYGGCASVDKEKDDGKMLCRKYNVCEINQAARR
jgi:hypothetical protein